MAESFLYPPTPSPQTVAPAGGGSSWRGIWPGPWAPGRVQKVPTSRGAVQLMQEILCSFVFARQLDGSPPSCLRFVAGMRVGTHGLAEDENRSQLQASEGQSCCQKKKGPENYCQGLHTKESLGRG